MIEKAIGTKSVYIVSGNCGANYKDELKKFKKELKKQGKKVDGIIVTRALVFTTDLDK